MKITTDIKNNTIIQYDPHSKKQVLWLVSLFEGMSDSRKCKILFNALSIMEGYNGRGMNRTIAEATFDYLRQKEKIQFKEYLEKEK
jgi:hypothetical protein